MAPLPYQVKMMELYIEQELTLAKLYRGFSALYPEHASFWNSLARDELEHAGWIKVLRDYATKGMLSFQDGRTKTYTIATFIGYIHETAKKAQGDKTPLVRALSIASDIENSLLEKNIFGHFTGESPEVRQILRVLQEGQRNHASRISRYAAHLTNR